MSFSGRKEVEPVVLHPAKQRQATQQFRTLWQACRSNTGMLVRGQTLYELYAFVLVGVLDALTDDECGEIRDMYDRATRVETLVGDNDLTVHAILTHLIDYDATDVTANTIHRIRRRIPRIVPVHSVESIQQLPTNMQDPQAFVALVSIPVEAVWHSADLLHAFGTQCNIAAHRLNSNSELTWRQEALMCRKDDALTALLSMYQHAGFSVSMDEREIRVDWPGKRALHLPLHRVDHGILEPYFRCKPRY